MEFGDMGEYRGELSLELAREPALELALEGDRKDTSSNVHRVAAVGTHLGPMLLSALKLLLSPNVNGIAL